MITTWNSLNTHTPFFFFSSDGLPRPLPGVRARSGGGLAGRFHVGKFPSRSSPAASTAEEEASAPDHLQRGTVRAAGGDVWADTLPGRRPQGAAGVEGWSQGGEGGGRLFCLIIITSKLCPVTPVQLSINFVGRMRNLILQSFINFKVQFCKLYRNFIRISSGFHTNMNYAGVHGRYWEWGFLIMFTMDFVGYHWILKMHEIHANLIRNL